MSYRIWISPPELSGDEGQYISEALSSNWIATVGPQVEQFEDRLRLLTGRKFCLAVNSATSAIHLALLALNLSEGDEVLCPTFTFAASVFPVVYCKAIPVFIDSEAGTWNISPILLEKAIEDRLALGKKVKALIAVNIYGNPVNYKAILAIASQYNIPVIEDAAESLGAQYESKPSGSFGKIAIFSFNGNKIITASSGGALLTDDETVYKKAKLLSAQAIEEEGFYLHKHIGYNYRMSNILAALGLSQIEVLQKRINRRRAIFDRYAHNFREFTIQEEEKNAFSNRWLSSFLFESMPMRNRIYACLKEKGIESRFLMNPMHLQPALKHFPAILSGVSEGLFSRGLCLPSGASLSEEEQNEIIAVINAISK